jgi:hypothetical protein
MADPTNPPPMTFPSDPGRPTRLRLGAWPWRAGVFRYAPPVYSLFRCKILALPPSPPGFSIYGAAVAGRGAGLHNQSSWGGMADTHTHTPPPPPVPNPLTGQVLQVLFRSRRAPHELRSLEEAKGGMHVGGGRARRVGGFDRIMFFLHMPPRAHPPPYPAKGNSVSSRQGELVMFRYAPPPGPQWSSSCSGSDLSAAAAAAGCSSSWAADFHPPPPRPPSLRFQTPVGRVMLLSDARRRHESYGVSKQGACMGQGEARVGGRGLQVCQTLAHTHRPRWGGLILVYISPLRTQFRIDSICCPNRP